MARVTYISIDNFKIFGKTIRIDLAQPTVLIGPNNAGKTSVLQAFALWSLGVKTWNMLKGKSKGRIRYGVPINRLNLHQLPVQNARFLWNNSEVRKGSTELIPVRITLGLLVENQVHDCTIEFTQQSSEMLYCKPTGILIENSLILDIATQLQVNLLYSMSGIAVEEVRHQPERVNYLMGQGMTSEVLRNLCYNIACEEPGYWTEIERWMEKLFGMHLQTPQFNAGKGVLELVYKHRNNKKTLDIASAGRGALQILLLLSYMYLHRNSVILVDEPDAHLEIIKQKTVFALLNDVAEQNDIQLILATHSEVVLNETVDNGLAMILDGESIPVSDKNKDIKPILKEFGVEHYYKASITHSILYIESSTDISILKSFARLLGKNRALKILEGDLNYYYTRNPSFIDSIENIVDRAEGYYSSYLRHYSSIKRVIPDFCGLAIFDSDGRESPQNNYPEGLTVHKWRRYEIENYFISPDILDRYFSDYLGGADTLHYQLYLDAKKRTITDFLFDGNVSRYEIFENSSPDAQQLFWEQSGNKKASLFLDMLMDNFVKLSDGPYPMRKGEYHKLVGYMPAEKVDQEISTVLDLIEKTFA